MKWAVIAAALVATACEGKRGARFDEVTGGSGSSSGSGSGSAERMTGWEGACAQALRAAPAASPFERFDAIARACPVCGVDWKPVLQALEVDANETTAADRLAVDAVVKACGGSCTTTARDRFLASFDQIKDAATLARPWRQLARDCKDTMAPSPNDRFASAAWYILSRISAAKIAIDTPIELPIPAAHVNGAVIQLPEAAATMPELPALVLTVMQADVRVAPPATATLAAGALTTNVTETFPGAPLALDAIDAALAPAAGKTVAISAPFASPAIRLIEVMRAIKTAATFRLAAFAPAPHAGWPQVPGMLAVAITAGVPAGDHVVIGVAPERSYRVGTVTGTGPIASACSDHVPRHALAHATGGKAVPIVLAIDDGAIVEDIARVVEDAGAIGAASVALTAGDTVKWPSDLAPCPD